MNTQNTPSRKSNFLCSFFRASKAHATFWRTDSLVSISAVPGVSSTKRRSTSPILRLLYWCDRPCVPDIQGHTVNGKVLFFSTSWSSSASTSMFCRSVSLRISSHVLPYSPPTRHAYRRIEHNEGNVAAAKYAQFIGFLEQSLPTFVKGDLAKRREHQILEILMMFFHQLEPHLWESTLRLWSSSMALMSIFLRPMSAHHHVCGSPKKGSGKIGR